MNKKRLLMILASGWVTLSVCEAQEVISKDSTATKQTWNLKGVVVSGYKKLPTSIDSFFHMQNRLNLIRLRIIISWG